jgi:hypothetical protein
MKRILALTAVLVIGCGAILLAKEKPVTYKADTWRSVQVIDVVTLSKSTDAHTRQLVGVKCNFRGKDIRHMKPNWYQSSLWQPTPDQSGKFAYVPVMVAKADVEAFKSRPAAPARRSRFTVTSSTTSNRTIVLSDCSVEMLIPTPRVT